MIARSGQLVITGGNPSISTGDTNGPASSTEDGIATFSNTSGKDIRSNPVRIIGESICVSMVNKTGGQIEVGHALTPSPSVDGGVVLATFNNIMGCAQEVSANDGDPVWVAIAGKFLVLCDATAVATSTELDLVAAGIAHDHGSGVPGIFAISISAKGAGAGTVLAIFHKDELY